MNGKVALVTGGGRGIGRAIALKLAQSGADVAINFLEREDSAQEVVSWIKGLGRRAIAVRADVSTEAGVEKLFQEFSSEFPRLDIVVNNAGPFIVRPVLETTSEEWDLMLRGNLLSAAWVTQKATELMIRSENGGTILFIGAPNAERVGSQHVACAYSIAKTGVVILAQTLARELGSQHIRVNVINPGFIENDSMTPRMRQWMPSEVPLGEIGTPADIANAAVYLCSDTASYVTGAVLNVHGGLWI
ncbi:MAG: SDR family oxidoreductase [Calditrichaeota bacterium]|nr:SDR family oxidoreductase [Calditrichota bacterium]